MKKIFLFLFAVLTLTTLTTKALADDDDFENYDNIINDLNTTTRAPNPSNQSQYGWNDILFHFNTGFAVSYLTLQNAGRASSYGFIKGAEFDMGIDLFSPHWQAYGAVRSFATQKLDSVAKETADLKVSLKEFDLMLYYRPLVANRTVARIAGGMSVRYLDYIVDGQKTQYTTPTFVLAGGFDMILTKSLQLGTEISVRTPASEESIEQTAFNAGLQLGLSF